jgi:hypothetical protein
MALGVVACILLAAIAALAAAAAWGVRRIREENARIAAEHERRTRELDREFGA